MAHLRCDPCGLVCIAFVYLIVIYSDYAYVRWILLTSNHHVLILVNGVLYQAMVLLLLWSHAKASLSDPGLVPHPRYPLDFSREREVQQRLLNEEPVTSDEGAAQGKHQAWTICQKCETYRPPRAHHCRICRRCVRKMDHHCPWINNCVGELNQKYFIQFLFYVALVCLYTVISIGISYIKSDQPSPQKMVHTIILLIESLLFGIFVAAVLTDQVQAVFSDETSVERWKVGKVASNKPRNVLMTEVCGPGPTYLWLFPCIDASRRRKKGDQFIV